LQNLYSGVSFYSPRIIWMRAQRLGVNNGHRNCG
jgi:hypothetical protein